MATAPEEESRYSWLRPVAASLVTGILSGLGSFYVAARPEVQEVESQSLRSDVILCQSINENRMLIRGVAQPLLVEERIPPGADKALIEYIEDRNTRRERASFRIEDATRPIDCNGGMVGDE